MMFAKMEGLEICLMCIYTLKKISLRVNIEVGPERILQPENLLKMQHLHCTICSKWPSMKKVAFSLS